MKLTPHPLPGFLLKGFEQKVPTPAYQAHVSVPFVDLQEVNRGLEYPMHFDIQYATPNNFLKKQVYPAARAFLVEHVAIDLIRAHRFLNRMGYGFIIFDGYRPWSVTKLFYEECKPHERDFFADPTRGSSHNRGCAVDLSLYSLQTGKPCQMPSEFDEASERAFVAYDGGPSEARMLRELLQTTMKEHHFTGIRSEWWHFNHRSHQKWPIIDLSFEEIERAPRSPGPHSRW